MSDLGRCPACSTDLVAVGRIGAALAVDCARCQRERAERAEARLARLEAVERAAQGVLDTGPHKPHDPLDVAGGLTEWNCRWCRLEEALARAREGK